MQNRIFRNIIIAITVHFCCITATFGQMSHDDSLLLQNALDFFPCEYVKSTYYVVDSVSPSEKYLENLQIKLQQDTVWDTFLGKDYIILTEVEREYILSQSSQSYLWRFDIPNSTRIPPDSAWIIIGNDEKQRELAMKEALRQRDTEAYWKAVGELRPYVFWFARPMYIRNNSVCLFTFQAICGGTCGKVIKSFYKKESNEWVEWVRITDGSF